MGIADPCVSIEGHTETQMMENVIFFLTLKHRKELEPHFEKRIVTEKSNCDWLMGQNVVEIGNERPVAMFLHDLTSTIDNVMKIFRWI